MSDGACCHYCRKYTCECVEMPGEKDVYPETITPTPEEQEWYVIDKDGEPKVYKGLTQEELEELRQRAAAFARGDQVDNASANQMASAVSILIRERDEARCQACCLAHRIRQYQHFPLTDLHKELAAGEAACEWLKDVRRSNFDG